MFWKLLPDSILTQMFNWFEVFCTLQQQKGTSLWEQLTEFSLK